MRPAGRPTDPRKSFDSCWLLSPQESSDRLEERGYSTTGGKRELEKEGGERYNENPSCLVVVIQGGQRMDKNFMINLGKRVCSLSNCDFFTLSDVIFIDSCVVGSTRTT